jgi:hypothetical protein
MELQIPFYFFLHLAFHRSIWNILWKSFQNNSYWTDFSMVVYGSCVHLPQNIQLFLLWRALALFPGGFFCHYKHFHFTFLNVYLYI